VGVVTVVELLVNDDRPMIDVGSNVDDILPGLTLLWVRLKMTGRYFTKLNR